MLRRARWDPGTYRYHYLDRAAEDWNSRAVLELEVQIQRYQEQQDNSRKDKTCLQME